MPGGYEQVPGTAPEEYGTIDPKGITEQTQQNLYGQPFEDMLRRGNQANLAWSLPAQDPNSFMSQYLNDFGGLTGAVTEATAPLSQQLENQMQRNIQQGTTQIGQSLSGLGGLRSSGMAEMAGRFAGDEAAKAGTQLAGAQLGLLQPLANQGMLGRQYALSQQMGQPMQALGLQANFGSPNYAAPQYAQQPGFLDYINAFGNLAGGAGGAISPFF